MKKIISTDKAPAAIGPYSQATMFGNMLITSGQIAINPQTGELMLENITIETKQVMENLKAVLTEAKMDFSHVLKCTIFLADMNDYQAVNEVYASFFDENPPAREAVQVSCLPKNVNVEISLMAGK